MIARRLLTPPVIIGFLLVAAVAVAGGFITESPADRHHGVV